MTSGSTVVLISCCSLKLKVASAARRMYRSAEFKEAVVYAERVSNRWFILSAKHGLVRPDDVLENYDHALRDDTEDEQILWSTRVAESLLDAGVQAPATIINLAGKTYRKFLTPLLKAKGFSIEEPMAHVQMFDRVGWLRTENARRNFLRLL